VYQVISKPFATNFSQQPQPDFFVIDGQKKAICGLWVNDNVGIIGHFSMANADEISGALDFCCKFLAEQGCQSILGPMNGNTWFTYRFVSWSSERAPFFMEPTQPAPILQAWLANGFIVDQTYISSEQTISEINENKYTLDSDFHLSYIDLNQFEAELDRLYQISIEAFADNVYYSNISKAGFFALYSPLKNKIQSSNMLLLKTNDGEVAGYLFGIPDLLQITPDTYIIKTLAVHPKYRSKHLGSYLVNRCLCDAYKNGFKKIIHALMHSANNSTKIGKDFTVIREYVLLKKNLVCGKQ